MLAVSLLFPFLEIFASTPLNPLDRAFQDIFGAEVAAQVILTSDCPFNVECETSINTFNNILIHGDELQDWKKVILAIKLLGILKDCEHYAEDDDISFINTSFNLARKLDILKNENKDDGEGDGEKNSNGGADGGADDGVDGGVDGSNDDDDDSEYKTDSFLRSLLKNRGIVTLHDKKLWGLYLELSASKDDDITYGTLFEIIKFTSTIGPLKKERRQLLIPKILSLAGREKCILQKDLVMLLDTCIGRFSLECLKEIEKDNPCLDARLLSKFTDYNIAANKFTWPFKYLEGAVEAAKEWAGSEACKNFNAKSSTKVPKEFTYDICNPAITLTLISAPPDTWTFIKSFDNIFSSNCEVNWEVADRIYVMDRTHSIWTWPKAIREKAIDALANLGSYYSPFFYNLPQLLVQDVLAKMTVYQLVELPVAYSSIEWILSIYRGSHSSWVMVVLLGTITPPKERNGFFDEDITGKLESEQEKMIWILYAQRIVSTPIFESNYKIPNLNNYSMIVEEVFGVDSFHTNALLDVSASWSPEICKKIEADIITRMKQNVEDDGKNMGVEKICMARTLPKPSLQELYKVIEEKLVSSEKLNRRVVLSDHTCKSLIARLHTCKNSGLLGDAWMSPYIDGLIDSTVLLAEEKDTLKKCYPLLFGTFAKFQTCLANSAVPLHSDAVAWFYRTMFDKFLNPEMIESPTLLGLLNKLTKKFNPTISSSLDLKCEIPMGVRLKREYLHRTGKAIEGPRGVEKITSSELLVSISEGLDGGGPTRFWIDMLLSGLAEPELKLMKDIGEKSFIPEWFISASTAFSMGIIYAKVFLLKQRPLTSLAPEFINLLIDAENIEEVDQFYEKYYPLETIQKFIIFNADLISNAKPTDFANIANLMDTRAYSNLSKKETNNKKLLFTLWDNYARMEFHTSVGEFKRGLSNAFDFSQAAFIYPSSRVYELFTAPELTFEALWSAIVIYDGRDQKEDINSFVEGQSMNIDKFIESIIKSLNKEERVRFVQQVTGSSVLSLDASSKITISIIEARDDLTLQRAPHICALLPMDGGTDIQKSAAVLFSNQAVAKDLMPLNELFSEDASTTIQHLLEEAKNLTLDNALITPTRYIELVRNIAKEQLAILLKNTPNQTDLKYSDPFDPENPNCSDGPFLPAKVFTCFKRLVLYYSKYPGEFVKQIRFLEYPLDDFKDA